MKKILGLILVIIAALSCNNSPKSYNIDGEITGVSNTLINLYKVEGSKLVKMNSCTSEDGKFHFSGSVMFPEQYYLQVGNIEDYIKFYVENSNIEIQINPADENNTQIIGSETERIIQLFVKENREKHTNIINNIIDSLESLPPSPSSYSDGDKILAPLHKNQKTFQYEFVLKHKNTAAAPIILWNFTSFNLEQNQVLYKQFSEENKQSPTAKKIKKMNEKMEKTAVGQIAPHFSMPDTIGNLVSTSDYIGKYLFIDFWASSCRPCRYENPHLIKIYEKYQTKNFEILGVSFDDHAGPWKTAIIMDSLPWQQVSELKGWNNVAKAIYDNPLPGSVLIDPKGIINAKNLKHKELENILKKILE